MKLVIAVLVAVVGSVLWSSARAACIDLSQQKRLEVSGELSRPMFAGPPNYTDVRQGDTPEPTYILTLHSPICVTGDEFLEDNRPVDDLGHLSKNQ
jgi:hypothetical protein